MSVTVTLNLTGILDENTTVRYAKVFTMCINYSISKQSLFNQEISLRGINLPVGYVPY